MDYTTYVTRLQTMAVDSSALFSTTAVPMIIEYAELRIYRDLDLLSTVSANDSFNLTGLSRKLAIAEGTFVTVQEINIVTPVGASSADAGTRNAVLPVSKEFLDLAYPSVSGSALPSYFAMLNTMTILFGPWPDQNYRVEIVGTVRPAALSSTNTSTFISTYLPDLFLAASMVFVAGYQKNFGAQADDPKMATSWEQQYQTLLQGASIEEARRKFQASMWTSLSPAPAATSGRG